MLFFLSLHAGSENASEQLKELHALMREDLTPMERVYVRRSIEQHKLGTNRTLLGQVRGPAGWRRDQPDLGLSLQKPQVPLIPADGSQ